MIHHVYANQSNVGDWLSARGIQALLGRGVTEHFCDAPFVPATLAALNQAGPEDFILLGGGGLFMDYFAPFWEGFRPVGRRVPYAIWGVGACDLKRESSLLSAGTLRALAEGSRLCVVRDDLTRELLQPYAAPPPVICPAVVAVAAGTPGGGALLHVDHYHSIGAGNYERVVALTREFARRTGRALRTTNNLIERGRADQRERVLGAYAAADLIVTSRLHGCILGLAMGRRVLAVSGDRKVEAFMTAAGLADWVVDLDRIETLPERLEALPLQPPVDAFIADGRRKNRDVATAVLARLPQTGDPVPR